MSPSRPGGSDPARGLYRVALHLLPAAFRHRFGPELEADFADTLDRARGREGRPAAALVTARALLDVARRAPMEHWNEHRRRPRAGRGRVDDDVDA